MIPDTTDPKPDPTPETELAAARQRVEELDEQLFEAEQELEAATGIIDKQDREIADLKFRLECVKILLELEEDARRILDRQLAEAKGATSRPRPVIAPVPKKPAAARPPGYPPGYRPNTIVEAMIAAARASGKL